MRVFFLILALAVGLPAQAQTVIVGNSPFHFVAAAPPATISTLDAYPESTSNAFSPEEEVPVTFDAGITMPEGRTIDLVEYLIDASVVASVSGGSTLATTADIFDAGTYPVVVRVTDDLATVTTSSAFDVTVVDNLYDYVPGDANYTHTRTGNGRYINASGVQVTVGTNVLRDSHYILSERTTLVEEATTNLFTKSEVLGDNGVWTKLNTSTNTNIGTAAPDATFTTDELVEDNATGLHRAQNSFSFTSGLTYTMAVFFRAGTNRTKAQLQFGSAAFGSAAGAQFDLSAGTIISTYGGAEAAIVPLTDGWYRCAIKATAIATASAGAQINILDDTPTASYTGTSGNTIMVWGMMLTTTGYRAYIVSDASQGTRSADVFSLTDTFTSHLFTQYLRWWDPFANAFVDSVTEQTSTAPPATVLGRSYTHIIGSVGSRSIATMRLKAGL